MKTKLIFGALLLALLGAASLIECRHGRGGYHHGGYGYGGHHGGFGYGGGLGFGFGMGYEPYVYADLSAPIGYYDGYDRYGYSDFDGNYGYSSGTVVRNGDTCYHDGYGLVCTVSA